MSHILVISQHSGQIDRRIVAEVNALAASGRVVTLVSVPTVIPEACLDARVRLIMPHPVSLVSLPPRPGNICKQVLKHLAQQLPSAWEEWLRTAWQKLRTQALTTPSNYFLDHTPPEHFDAIHCHDLDTLPLAIEVRAKIAPRAKLIYDSHELFPFQFVAGDTRQRHWSRIEAQHIHAADLVITVNESIAQEFARLYTIDPPEIIYNSYGTQGSMVPLEEEAFLQHFGAKPGGFRVMFQGGLVREKNVANLVKAFQQLDSSLQLFLLGNGPLEAELKKLCVREHITNVFFGDWVPQEDLLRYVAQSHLGVIPYLGDALLNNRYCTPNKLFEFIEAAVPVCASDLPELRRVVAGYGIGDVFPMETPEAIAHALALCRARCERGEFAVALRQAAREEFAWERQGAKLVHLYERLGV